MPRITRWSVPFALALLLGCQDQPVAPEKEGALETPSAAVTATEVQSMRILTDELVSTMWYADGINDSGWVFGSYYDPTFGDRGVMWRTLSDTDTIHVFSAPHSDNVNRRGDYVNDDKRLYVIWDSGGRPAWTPRQTSLPAGWVAGSEQYGDLNDALVVVGTGRTLSRSVTDRKGVVTYYRTPYIWTPQDGARALPLPTPTSGCSLTNVFAREINNAGVIVGDASQGGSGKVKCHTMAIVWPSATATPQALPRPPVITEYQRLVAVDDTDFQASEINDRGDIGGNWTYSGSYRALRWTAPSGGGPYGAPEVLSGFHAYPEDMDECGRILFPGGGDGGLGVWDPGAPNYLTRLANPAGWDRPAGRAIHNNLVIGMVYPVGSGGRSQVVAWTLTPCN